METPGQQPFIDYGSAVQSIADEMPLGQFLEYEYPSGTPGGRGMITNPTKVSWEAMSVDSYTGSLFGTINRKLRSGEGLSSILSETTDALDVALGKLPAYEGVTYRGIRFDEDQEQRELLLKMIHSQERGGFVTFKEYASTSVDQGEALSFTTQKQSMLMHLEGKSGRVLGQYSRYEKEKEVLFGKNSRWEFTRFEMDEQAGSGRIHVFLRELE